MIMKLTNAQCSIAAHVAAMRRNSNRQQQRKQRHGLKKWTWSMEVEACCAELAVARYLNLYWDGGDLDRRDERDVGGMVDVRHTEWPNGRLMLHADDKDHVPYVLVTGRDGVFDLAGWNFASEGKQERWWSDPTGEDRPAYFADRRILRPMEWLRDWVELQPPLWQQQEAA